MALLHADGFDHWGSAARMVEGVYASSTGTIAGGARTGDGCYQQVGAQELRFVTDFQTSLISGRAFTVLTNLPSTNDSPAILAQLADANNAWMLQAHVTATGSIRIMRNSIYPSNGTVPVAPYQQQIVWESDHSLVRANNWHYFEWKYDDDGHFVAVQLDGIYLGQGTVILPADILIERTQRTTFCADAFAAPNMRYDDYYICNKEPEIVGGDEYEINNDFLGDRRMALSMPADDTAYADWALSSGTDGASLIDEIPANDAGYIEAASVDMVSEFTHTPLGISTPSIAGVVLYGRTVKTDAGTAAIRLGIHSEMDTLNSEAKSVLLTSSYSKECFPLNPNGRVPFTPATWDNANMRVTRAV